MEVNNKEFMENVITIGETAKILGVCIKTVRNWSDKGKIIPMFIHKKTKVRFYSKNEITKLMIK